MQPGQSSFLEGQIETILGVASGYMPKNFETLLSINQTTRGQNLHPSEYHDLLDMFRSGESSTDIYCKEVRELQPSTIEGYSERFVSDLTNTAPEESALEPIFYEIQTPNKGHPTHLKTLEQLDPDVRTFRIFPIGHTWQCKVN